MPMTLIGRLQLVAGCLAAACAFAAEDHPPAAASPTPRIVSVKKIWDGGNHNAFTDLIRFNGQWFCTFREAQAHVGGNGQIRVLLSPDGERWESSGLLSEDGIDLRDPKLSITPDNRLMLVLGGSIYQDKKLAERQPRTAFSANGHDWTPPKRVLEKDDWLWRVTWHKGHAYGIAYTSPIMKMPSPSGPVEWVLKLVESEDGTTFRLVTKFEVPSHPNESTVRFLANDDCVALVRREGVDKTSEKSAWIGTSHAPYKEWKWKSAGMQVGGPNFVVLPDGAMLAAGRQYNPAPTGAKTFVGGMNLESVTPQLILPSGGDCSYPGLVWHDGLLWVSYYSSHEGKTSIYLAKVAGLRAAQ